MELEEDANKCSWLVQNDGWKAKLVLATSAEARRETVVEDFIFLSMFAETEAIKKNKLLGGNCSDQRSDQMHTWL